MTPTEQILAYLKEKGYPEPELEYSFAKSIKRKWRFDLAFVEIKLAIEIEGGVYSGGRHTRGKGFENDIEKYAEAICLGWVVLRVTPGLIKKGKIYPWLEKIFNAKMGS
jgi:hypothetical protein